MLWARDQESTGGERHDQITGGCGTGVHGIPNPEFSSPHFCCTYTTPCTWMWLPLLLPRLCGGTGDGNRRFISFLRLQPLQQALCRETLAEMETPRAQRNSDADSGATGWRSGGHRCAAQAAKYRQDHTKTGRQCWRDPITSHIRHHFPMFLSHLAVVNLCCHPSLDVVVCIVEYTYCKSACSAPYGDP